MKREFHYQDDRSNKFWTVEQKGKSVVTTNGRIGAKPRETRKSFSSAETAARFAARQIASKLKKGYVEGALASAPRHSPPDWAALPMTEDTFWRIIALFNWKKTGDDEAVIAPAVKALALMPVRNILRFEDILARKLFALDEEKYARYLGEYSLDGPFFSGDMFLYVRCCAVANGKSFYQKALQDPKQMPRDLDFEPLIRVGPSAHELKTGRELDHVTPVSYETFSNTRGWSHLERRPR